MNKYKNLYFKKMNSEIANFIKETRKGSSWRNLATKVSEKYKFLKVKAGNQLEGMELCQAAKIYLNEND